MNACARRLALLALLAWPGMPRASGPAPDSRPAASSVPDTTASAGHPASADVPARPGPTASHSDHPAPDPCRDRLAALPSGGSDPAPYLAAAHCLRLRDSAAAVTAPSIGSTPAAAPGSRAPAGRRTIVVPATPLERSLLSPARRSGSASDSLLAARLPNDKHWYMNRLERLRVRRDLPAALDMAYLTEAKALAEADIFRELSAVYLIVPDTYRAGLALLRLAELDSTQSGYIQYQLDNLTRFAGSDTPADALVDSLTAAFRHRKAGTAEMLETVAWSARDYPAAYRNLAARMSLEKTAPSVVIERVNRFRSLGYFDYAAALLEKLAWRRLPQPWLSMGRTLHLQILGALKDWPGIAAEAKGSGVTGKEPSPRFNDEETLLIATAYLKLGDAGEALALAKRLEQAGESPWGFRGRLLEAQARMAQGKPGDAARTLAALKRDPARREGTGPILFWQACLALDRERFDEADSLLVLASAYTEEEEAQRALEYRFFLLADTGSSRADFFRGLPESPRSRSERARSLDRVDPESGLWPFARLEKAQIHLQKGEPDSALAILDAVGKRSPDRLAGFEAEAKAAFVEEKLPGGRQAALARYENLLIKYQQGVIPQFSRGRIRALR